MSCCSAFISLEHACRTPEEQLPAPDFGTSLASAKVDDVTILILLLYWIPNNPDVWIGRCAEAC
eukprot:scaffold4452_cov40-Cyclotella_meneghiniana.AAC.2